MSLNGSLLEYPIPEDTRHLIVNNLWNTTESHAVEPYFQYYTEQCRIAYLAHGPQISAKSHQHVATIATHLRNGLARSTIRENLQGTQNDDSTDSSVDLTIRLMLMVDIGELHNAFSGRRRLIWPDETSLQEFVRDIFPDKTSLSHDGIKLGTQFTARNLDRVTGFRVELTTNLADHLRLRSEGDKTVSIFHHASFLRCQKQNPLFPKNLMEETLWTLALMFPQGDKDSRRWYYKQGNLDDLDIGVLDRGHLHDDYLQIEKYTFWHDRLIMLKEAFDESQPRTLSQLWNDRREGSQWYALWAAIGLTLFFGLVQSIEGAWQVYKAYKPSP